MSIYSGKCDVADHISGMGGWFDKDGNPVKFSDPNVHALYSDEWLDFLAFKKATGGVLHQHKVLTVTPWNHVEAEKLCPELKVIEHKKIVQDKRQKSGQREDIYYTYKYWGKEYTLKELNKRKVYITIDIHFDTLLDLIPYYPYIVTAACSNDGKQTVYISDQSFVDGELNGYLDLGWYSDYWQHYKKKLQDHYREVILKYYNPAGRELVEPINFVKEIAEDGTERYIGKTLHPIDENFDLKWRWDDGLNHSHWTYPKRIDDHRIEMSKEDFEHFIGASCKVYYVTAEEPKTLSGLR